MAQGRALTSGEIALARKIYGNALDYALIKIHDEKFVPVQAMYSGMSPRGEIFMAGVYSSDYSLAWNELKALFIHEMAHVYQYQLNILDPISAAIKTSLANRLAYKNAYYYKLRADRDLLDYGVEQQAQIIEDYYRINMLSLPPKDDYMLNKIEEVKRDKLFEKVLAKFIKNPLYAKHEIHCRKRKVHKSNINFCKRVLRQ